LANVVRDQEKYVEAVELYRKALALNPEESTTYFNLGFCLSELGELEPAVQAYRDGIRLDPNDADAHESLGDVLQDLGRSEEAVEEFREADRLGSEEE
jgi:tetratricopeptide (TPR) repeat protein